MAIAVKRRHLCIRRWLPLGKPRKVLNVGCGCLPLPGQPRGWRIFGLEVEKKPHERLVLYDGRTFPLHDAAFDLVLCLDVLEHVQDDGPMLAEIARVLRPGGALVLTTPAIDHDFKKLMMPLKSKKKDWGQAEAEWGHVRPGYRVGDLVLKCQQSGLDVIGVEKYGATIAEALYQLWYLGNLSWLFSWKLVLPRILMELLLRADQLLSRNRGCAIALKAMRR